MRTQTVLWTPTKAKEALKKMAPNRRVRSSLVARFASDMKAGRWRLTHQGIAFNGKGKLIDGQHRLVAVIESGMSVEMQVSYGCKPDSLRWIDLGGTRAVADQLLFVPKFQHITKPKRVAPCARAMLAGLRYRPCNISHDTVLRCIEKYGPDIEWVLEETGDCLRKAAVNAVITKASMIDGREKLAPFCHCLRDNVFPLHNDPANMLSRWLNRPRKTGAVTYRETYGKTVTAVRAHLSGRVFQGQLNASSMDIGSEDLIDEFIPRQEEHEVTT